MCESCGCSDGSDGIKIYKPGDVTKNAHVHNEHDHEHDHHVEIKLENDILHQNKLLAERNRGFFEAKKICAINLVSSPGSGKTTLLEYTLKSLGAEVPTAVIEGDQQTSNDADRIAATGAPVVQINTGKTCHLDAHMVRHGVDKLNLQDGSILFIENVGNLVCPSLFDLGEAKRVVIMSVTEGDDKALKYPYMFESSQICIINKMDLLPYVNYDVDKAMDCAKRVNPNLKFFKVSATDGSGMDEWKQWLKEEIKNQGTFSHSHH
jgi:hydrogenase nickel incorporation protein HypB